MLLNPERRLRALAGLSKLALIFTVFGLSGCLGEAQKDSAQRVQFAHGASSATLEHSVVRGTRDRYLVGGKAGQSMTVTLTSLEHNAVFSIAKPDGKYLSGVSDEEDATHWSGKLPLTGDFVVEVGGTRGNAKYVLKVAIK